MQDLSNKIDQVRRAYCVYIAARRKIAVITQYAENQQLEEAAIKSLNTAKIELNAAKVGAIDAAKAFHKATSQIPGNSAQSFLNARTDAVNDETHRTPIHATDDRLPEDLPKTGVSRGDAVRGSRRALAGFAGVGAGAVVGGILGLMVSLLLIAAGPVGLAVGLVLTTAFAAVSALIGGNIGLAVFDDRQSAKTTPELPAPEDYARELDAIVFAEVKENQSIGLDSDLGKALGALPKDTSRSNQLEQMDRLLTSTDDRPCLKNLGAGSPGTNYARKATEGMKRESDTESVYELDFETKEQTEERRSSTSLRRGSSDPGGGN